jgi:RimJ/RimL family protein N-acetyltransferase
MTAKEHAAYIAEHGCLPMKKRKDEVIERVYAQVEERGIWIPYGQFSARVRTAIDRLNHKNPMFTLPKKKKPPKQKTPRTGIEEFSDDVLSDVKEKIAANVKLYIQQAHRIPPNQIRSGHLKNIVRSFNINSAKSQTAEKLLKPNDELVKIYNEIRQSIYDELYESGEIPREISKSDRAYFRQSDAVLETERLILRKMSAGDHQNVKEMLSSPDTTADCEHMYPTKREITEWIVRQINRYSRETAGYFIAIDRETGKIVGQTGLMWNDIKGRRCLEVGYILKKEHWGKGYASEGAAACIEYGFELFGVNKIYAVIRPENARAAAVAERIGMKLDGECIRSADGKKVKHLIYSAANPAKTTQ